MEGKIIGDPFLCNIGQAPLVFGLNNVNVNCSMHSHLLSGILVVIKEQKVKVGKTVYWGGGVSINSEHPSHKFFEGDFLHILYLQKASPLPG